LLGLAGMAPAQSAPVPAAGLAASQPQSDATPVQMRRDFRHRRGYKKGHRHGYRAGNRYSHPPRGWHRYHKRPYNWHSRGCIVVGPMWFCP